MAIAAVVFDLDGLMFNTEELYIDVGSELLRRRGKVLSRDLLDQMMGRPSRVALQTMIDWHQLGDSVSGLAEETDEIFVDILDQRLAPMPGLLELLSSLELRGIPKAVATSSRRDYAEDILDRYHLVRRFRFLLTADDVTNGKPAPEIYERAARQHDCRPADMLVLEDSEAGCAAAVAAGALIAAVPGPHNRHHCFPDVNHVASSLRDPWIYQQLDS